MRRVMVVAASLVAALCSFPAEMPVKRVVLYKHGVGFFEREGVVNAGEELRLEFQNNDMNDVLKSLKVTDLSGGRVRSVRYDSNETPEQRLAKFPFQIGDQQRPSAFLDHMKGERVQLKLPDNANVAGSIIGARQSWDGHDQISLLLDSGDVSNYDLEKVSSLRFEDTRFQDDLKEYLRTLGQSKSREKRSLYIESEGKDARRLRADYIAPAAIWKSSYRLALGEASSTLEGWAIVDNTTDEDWNGVELSVVSGRPISFVSLLDTPRYGNRQVAELPEDKAAGPIVYGGAIEEFTKFGRSDGTHLGTGSGNGLGAGNGGGSGGGVYNPAAGLATSAQMEQVTNSIQGATGATLGELFEYNFPAPITVKKNQSAMLPFLQDKLQARKLLIHSAGRDDEHPVNAAELTNSTEKTLDGGPITVYDGGAYAGEALFETLKAGDKRLIGYAVDYGTRVEEQSESHNQSVREIHVVNGTLRVRYSQRQTQTYTVHNVDAKQKTLIIEQATADYTLISPKPIERTAKAYRFELKLPANASQKLEVEQENVTFEETALTNATPDQLIAIVSDRHLSEAERAQLQTLSDLKRRIVELTVNLASTKSQLDDINSDQTRTRANIDSLNRVKGQEEQVARYSAQLASNESQIATLRDQQRSFSRQKGSLETQLRDSIQKLAF